MTHVVKLIVLALSIDFGLAGCGRHYWVKPGAMEAEFLADSNSCATGRLVEKAYRRCLQLRGWSREQHVGRPASGFRGLTDDDDEGTTVWYCPDFDLQQFNRDEYECTREVAETMQGSWTIGPLWWVLHEKGEHKDRASRLYEQCLQSRGYQLRTVSDVTARQMAARFQVPEAGSEQTVERPALSPGVSPYVGDWTGKLSFPKSNPSDTAVDQPVGVRIAQDGNALRWTMANRGGEIYVEGGGRVEPSEDGLTLTGTYQMSGTLSGVVGRQSVGPTPVSFTLERRGSSLEGAALTPANQVLRLSLTRTRGQ